MEVTHGAVVLVDGPAGEPQRPCVVVQSDLFNATHATITVCPLTNVIGGEALFRVVMSPREENGLTAECEVQIDRITSVARDRITALLGRASPTRMEQIDQALRRWLML
jgi:mRNA interferase MazF